jgi:hypothetical protein
MATRRPSWADLALVRSDAGDQQRRESRSSRGRFAPQRPGFADQGHGQLGQRQQRHHKAVAAEAFPEAASGVEQARVSQTGPADWPRPVWIAVVVVASASEARHASSVHLRSAWGKATLPDEHNRHEFVGAQRMRQNALTTVCADDEVTDPAGV